jgi:hypothetical protein
MRNLPTLLVAMLFIPVPAFAEEDTIPWDRIAKSCEAYLEAFSTPKQVKKMRVKLKEKIATRVSDTKCDEDTAAREIMLDWAADNNVRLVNREREALVQACFFFKIFREKNYLVPMYIRDSLTPENVDKLCSFLDEEAHDRKPKN